MVVRGSRLCASDLRTVNLLLLGASAPVELVRLGGHVLRQLRGWVCRAIKAQSMPRETAQDCRKLIIVMQKRDYRGKLSDTLGIKEELATVSRVWPGGEYMKAQAQGWAGHKMHPSRHAGADSAGRAARSDAEDFTGGS